MWIVIRILCFPHHPKNACKVSLLSWYNVNPIFPFDLSWPFKDPVDDHRHKVDNLVVNWRGIYKDTVGAVDSWGGRTAYILAD